MATRSNESSGGRSTSPKSCAATGQERSLPAEPEVTGRPPAASDTSNPGREPAHLAAARARRQRATEEEAMRREYQQSQQPASCAPGSSLSTGLKLIGGAGLGAVLMYLLDPEAGERRREEMRLRAARAAATTGTVLGNVADMAGNVAGNVWDLSTEAGRAMAERAAQIGSTGVAAASGLGSSLAERASDTAYAARKGARRQMRSARKGASGWFGHEEEKSYVPDTSVAVSAATALAAGAGLMYLLDPADGARRRALVRDKATRFLNDTGDFFRRTGRHLANRSRGIAHETRSMFQPADEASDRTVAERVRARLGHLQRPNADVNVAVMDGRVTITGRCTPDDVDAVLSTVQSTPGVVSIVNLLTVENPGASQSAPSSTL
ncbi:MAG TPA: BON domain-containing protein [Tepidisphaeraceae bacterium]|nr:BON domain-containing protein [Tepidisphaeraceae bacterium]